MLLSLKWMPKVGEKRFRLSVLSFTLVTKQTPYGSITVSDRFQIECPVAS